jgi:hypothetical protein
MPNRTVHVTHYEDLQRVIAHAARSYYKSSKSIYTDSDRSKLESQSAHINILLTQGAAGYMLAAAAELMFQTITFALKRVSKGNHEEGKQ